jgi:predicted ATPase/transcriptional regulator with XRE-family HTH domain
MEEASRPEASHPPERPQESFGWLLRRYRLAAGLTQEELADRAGLSVKGLSALEGGKRQTPYRHTVTLLATALGLTASETATLEAAVVRARAPASAGASVMRSENRAPGETVPQLVPIPPEPCSNLPAPLTSFIGREREQAEVVAVLGRARLVTLTGAGGCGKTRLALAVAGRAAAAYPEGVWLVELAALADPALLPQTVVLALGLQEQPGRSPLETLAGYLKHRCLLLVLDNCEHLVGACAELAVTLLQRCPQLRILATGREPLAAPGEALYRVPSLSVPDLAHLPSPDRLAQYEAVQLFVERAQARRTDFALNSRNAEAVAQVCVRLDGMPLAIELAAARIDMLPVQTIAARLDDRFRLLTGGPRTALPRHQTLRATLDWSHDLLSLPEQVLLRRLAVFAGGCTLEAAETVCIGEALAKEEILDLLGSLIHKSLVQAEEIDGSPRYHLLETVRQYGYDLLVAAGEEAAVQDAHLAYFLALAERAYSAFWGPEEGHWIARLEAEHDNLRAALRWSLRADVAVAGLKLVDALGTFWYKYGHLREGLAWLGAALAKGSTAVPQLRARALYWAGLMAWTQGDNEQARTAFETCRALSHEVRDKVGAGYCLNMLGDIALYQGNPERARALVEESLALLEESLAHDRTAGDPSALSSVDETPSWRVGSGPFSRRRCIGLIAESRMRLGDVVLAAGDHGRAVALYEASLALAHTVGDSSRMGYALMRLGQIAKDQGDNKRAIAFFTESLELFRLLGNRNVWALSSLTIKLGLVALEQGEHRRAEDLLQRGLKLLWEAGIKREMAACLEGLAALAGAQGRWLEAAQLLGAAAVVREAHGALQRHSEQVLRDRTVAAAQVALGEAAFAAAWAGGRALPLDEAVPLALAHAQPTEGQAD